MQAMVDWIVNVVGQWGYTGIVIMMTLESSFVPFPSEVVMIPAGFLASPAYLTSPEYRPGHEINIWVAILWGIVGSWVGALVNYYMAVYLGRPFLLRWGKCFFLDGKKFVKVERFFARHGEIGTFTGRLIPVVRQYISFPAGLARMNIGRFLFYTGLGAGLWVTVLAWIGYLAGQNRDLIEKYFREATIGAVAFCAVVIVVYVLPYHRKKHNQATGTKEKTEKTANHANARE
ncbi:MAG: DedA family protein [Verrucomicrobiota bacterium]|nr:DedA family protein [Verrucomicrobiota bacterium]